MKQKKHILIISLHADPMLPPGIGEYGGGHMYPYELLIGLYKENFLVSLITRKFSETMPEVDYINEFTTIYRLDYANHPFQDKRDFYNLRDISLLLTNELLEKNNIHPDIIHSLYWNSGYLAMQLSQKLQIPYVHSPISVGAIIKKEAAKEIEPHRIATEQTVFENASKILSITESEKLNIIEYYNISKEKISIIGRPIANEYLYPIHDEWGNTRNQNLEYFSHTLSISSFKTSRNSNWWEKKAFIYVGRIHPNKGIHHIIKAWIMLKEEFKNECPPLWLVGGTPVEIDNFHIEQNLHLDSYEKKSEIIWWGRLNAEGISTLYTRSLVLIMHSKYEPGGRVSVEAMSSGLPVIATPCGFAADTIKDWYTGFLVKYGDEKQLAKRMRMFILQPYLANNMGYNAKQTALEISKKWNFLKHHVAIYNQLIFPYFNKIDKDNTNQIIHTPQWILGLISTYPASLPEVSKDYIFKKFKNAKMEDIHITDKSYLEHLGYHIWNATYKDNIYCILQPYNILNILRLMDIKRYSKVIFADTIYEMFDKWTKIFPSPILFLDSEKYLIFTEKYNSLDYNIDEFFNIVQFIDQNKNSISSKIKDKIVALFSENLELYETIYNYQSYVSSYTMFSQADFSIIIEAKWILNKIKELNVSIPQNIISYLSKLSKAESKKNIVLGGFVHYKSLCKCKDKLQLLLPSMIHPVEDGYDEGMLLILTAWNNTNLIFWQSLIEKIPINNRQQAIKWAIIFLIKAILLTQIMCLNFIKPENIIMQLEMLIKFEINLK